MWFNVDYVVNHERKIILKPITETILNACDGSTTELARRLTVATGNYYTVNQVAHWMKVERVPAEHMQAVANAFDVPVENVRPDLFGMHHAQNNNRKNA